MKRVKDVMTSDVETLNPHDPVEQAARKMKLFDFGSLPVCEDGRVIGTLTDRDITLRVTAEGRDPIQTTVREVMTHEVVCVVDTQDISEAALLMQKHQVRRLPVVDRQKRLVGLISLGKLARADDEKLTAEILKGVLAERAKGEA